MENKIILAFFAYIALFVPPLLLIAPAILHFAKMASKKRIFFIGISYIFIFIFSVTLPYHSLGYAEWKQKYACNEYPYNVIGWIKYFPIGYHFSNVQFAYFWLTSSMFYIFYGNIDINEKYKAMIRIFFLALCGWLLTETQLYETTLGIVLE